MGCGDTVEEDRDDGIAGLFRRQGADNITAAAFPVLVTGASRAIGEAAARRFADAGAIVLVSARSAPPENLSATYIPADLSTERGVAELGQRVLDEIGGIDVLINNAGFPTPPTATTPTFNRSLTPVSKPPPSSATPPTCTACATPYKLCATDSAASTSATTGPALTDQFQGISITELNGASALEAV